MTIIDADEKVLRLGLSTIAQARASFGRILRAYYRDQIPEAKFRNMAYGFSILGGLFKAEMQQELEARLDTLEKRLDREVQTRTA